MKDGPAPEMSLLHRVARHFMPNLCPGCLRAEAGPASSFCQGCADDLHKPEDPACPSCGGKLDGILDVCAKCSKEDPFPWEKAVSTVNMGPAAKKLIHRFKYGGDVALARPIAHMAADAWARSGLRADIIVPVPSHWRRMLWRGYNQSGLLALVLSQKTGIPASTRLLARTGGASPQAGLARDARLKNLAKAFSPRNKTFLKNRGILLVDDVFTTGSTLRAASKALLDGGAAKVLVLTITRR